MLNDPRDEHLAEHGRRQRAGQSRLAPAGGEREVELHHQLGWFGRRQRIGIASFDVFVSDNGGPATSFNDDTSATVTGQAGHTYAFYTVATVGCTHGARYGRARS